MEAQLYRKVYQHIMSVAHLPRQKYIQFSDQRIVLVYVWAVLHDRAVTWACKRRNWPKEMFEELPSDTTLSRRLRSLSVVHLIERVLAAASDLFPSTMVKQMDSKPLIVGAYSKDRDAKRGRIAAGQFARGYRLHTLTHGRAMLHWTLGSMNEHDSVYAPLLLRHLQGGGYVVADNAYDSNDLHRQAVAVNHQLIAPPRVANRDVRDAKYNCPERLRALDILNTPLKKCGLRGAFGQQLYNQREPIESFFGELSMMGVNYLPAWVRGPRRVALWMATKLLIYLCKRAKIRT